MLEIRRIRENMAEVKAGLAKRGINPDLDKVVALDDKRRDLLAEVEELKALRNKESKELPMLKKEGKDVTALMEQMKEVSDKIKEYDDQVREVNAQIQEELYNIPNVPHSSVPDGQSDADNLEVRKFGEPTKFDFEPKAHWDLGADLDILDLTRAAKISGSRFPLYKGLGAKLERAIYSFMLNTHTLESGYTEIFPPYMVTSDCMVGTGQLPKFAEDMYAVKDTDLYLIPTAEVPVTNMHREEILDGATMTRKYCAYSACFRGEAGSAGRDTRGIIRVHQFNKVELVKFAKQEGSYDELESLTRDAEKILQKLGLPYRVVALCGGDLGFSSAKTYDIEVWMPSYGRYVEISSCSNFEDYQARRANIRYRDEDKKTRFVHTLNGSGLAVGRTWCAIVENYQQADGTVKIPDALVDFMGVTEIKK